MQQETLNRLQWTQSFLMFSPVARAKPPRSEQKEQLTAKTDGEAGCMNSSEKKGQGAVARSSNQESEARKLQDKFEP